MNTETENRIREFKQKCTEAGLRLTHQRMVIYRELIKDRNHPSAEDVYDKVLKYIPTISADTVYRTINTFEQYGLIQRVHVQDDRSRFDPNLEKHHHLICKWCKSIEDFEWQLFDSLNPPDQIQSWGVIDSKHVEFRGLCKKCLTTR